MSKKTEIKIIVELDDKNLPLNIEWQASEGVDGIKKSSTLMLSLWDKDEKVTLSIDLWAKEMLVDDMNIHFYQMLNKMSETYLKATNNNEVAKMIEAFAHDFAAKLNLLKKV
jgi:gliding motility-associated protein GldC